MQGSQNARRNTTRKHIRRNVMHNNSTCGNNRSPTHLGPWQNSDTCPKPCTLSNSDGCREARPSPVVCWTYLMTIGNEQTIHPHSHIRFHGYNPAKIELTALVDIAILANTKLFRQRRITCQIQMTCQPSPPPNFDPHQAVEPDPDPQKCKGWKQPTNTVQKQVSRMNSIEFITHQRPKISHINNQSILRPSKACS